MEQVLIVSKTKMRNGLCVSGLVLSTNESIRLIPKGRFNQTNDTRFNIGQIWDIEYEHATNAKPPHTEDVYVINQNYINDVMNLRDTIMQYVQPWQGGLKSLYNGMLTIGMKSCYIPASGPTPYQSTGYWIPSKKLTLRQEDNKYLVAHNSAMSYEPLTIEIPYVGLAEPIPQILPGTLVRVSLARWFRATGTNEDRCYLQISGWYL